MASVRLLPVTLDHLDAYRNEPAELGILLTSSIPDGWPEFPEAFEFTAERLREHPEQRDWWMHFFLDSETGALVGSGGFVGPPVDGTVEIGYEIAPPFRGRGYATVAAAELRDKAMASGEVDTVVAHTLAAEGPSTGVLTRLGFERVATFMDPAEGELWRWRWRAPEDPVG
jgi:[ribosomal protein S5]-alanine N-acetyltransferase